MRLGISDLARALHAPAKALVWARDVALGLLSHSEEEPPSVPERRTGRQMAYDAYRDDRGRPRFRYSCVLFWDVLGIRNMATSSHRLKHLRELREALDGARGRAGTDDPDMMHASTWFTDNVVLGTPVMGPQDVEMTLGSTQVDVAYMMLYMLNEGFLARGAIAFGEHYMDETFVFGPALIEAVDLEKDTKWPRVALTPDAAELNREMVRRYYSDPATSPQVSELACDENDEVFVDHLGVWLGEEDKWDVVEHYLPRYKRTIESSLATLKRNSPEWQKWKWLADFHNYSLKVNLPAEKRFLIKAGNRRHKFHSFGSTL